MVWHWSIVVRSRTHDAHACVAYTTCLNYAANRKKKLLLNIMDGQTCLIATLWKPPDSCNNSNVILDIYKVFTHNYCNFVLKQWHSNFILLVLFLKIILLILLCYETNKVIFMKPDIICVSKLIFFVCYKFIFDISGHLGLM